MAQDYNLAKAYVQIIPTTKGLNADLTNLLGQEGLAGGESAGNGIAAGLKKTLGLTGKVAAAGLASATTGLVAFGKSAVGAGSEFDAAMSQVMATMGFSVADLQTEGSIAQQTMEKLRGFAQEQGSTTAFSASQAASALNFMALAGYDAEKSMDMLPTVLDLAASGSMDLATASDMVTDAQSAFGLSTEDTKTMVDQMAKTASSTNTSVSQLGDAFLKIGATARVVKGGTQELSTILGVLADNGIKGTEGGTHLRNMLLSLQNPTDKGAAAMKQLGLEVYDSKGNMRSMIDIIGDMQGAMEGMSDEQKTSYLTSMFNKTDLSAVNALLGTSKDRFEKLSSAIGDASGSAKEMAKVQLDNLAGDVTLFKSALEGVQISLSDKLTPELRNFVQMGTEGLGKIQAGLESNGVAGAAGALGEVIGDLVQKLADDLPGLVKAGEEMLSSIIDGFISAVPTMASALPEITSTALEFITNVIDSVTENLPDIVKSLLNAWPDVISVILSAIPDITTAICDAIPEIVTDIIAMLPGFFVDIASAIIENFPKILGAVVKGMGSIVSGIGRFLADIVTGVAGTRKQIEDEVEKENTALHNFVKSLEEIEPQLASYDTIFSSKGNDLATLNEDIETYEGKITEVIGNAIKEQGELREKDLKEIDYYVGKIREKEAEKLEIYHKQQKIQLAKLAAETNILNRQQAEQHLANVTQALSDANAATEEAYETRIGIIQDKYSDEERVSSEAYKKEMETAKAEHDKALAENQSYYDKAVGILEQSVRDWGSKDAARWKDMAENFEHYKEQNVTTWNSITDETKTALVANDVAFAQALKDMDQTATNGLLNLVTDWKKEGAKINPATEEMVRNILNTFDGLPEELDEAGKDSLLGFIDGMEDKIPGLEKASEMSCQEIIDTIKGYLQIQSPSKKMEAIGKNVIEGLKEGMDDNKSTLTSEAKTIGQQMVAGVQSGVESKEGSIQSKISGMFRRIVNNAKANLQIASPSKVFENIGEMIGAGVEVGIEDSSLNAIDAAETMTEGITAATRGALETDYSSALSAVGSGLQANYTAAVESGSSGERKMDDLLDIVRALYRQMQNMQIVLDSGALVGGIKNQMDTAIGTNGTYTQRGMAI